MTARVPLFDLGRRWGRDRDAVLAVVDRLGAAGDFTLGDELAAFERELATACGVREAVGVSSGTAAIELALRAVGAGPGTDVVTCAHTFVATVEAIAATGARPVLVDADPQTRLLDLEAAQTAIGPRTAAVVAVHLYGRPVAVDALAAACAQHGTALVEDAAQAQGASLGGRKVGALGSAAALSFYPTKTLGAMGDGGAVVTGDDAVAATVRSLRHHGCAPDDANRHERPGGTERLDNLQAAVLRLGLRRLDQDNDARRAVAERYRERLAGLPVGLPPEDQEGLHQVFSLFVVEVADRDAVRERLAAAGIGTGVHYPTPVHLQPAWEGLGDGPGAFPVAERLAQTVLSLPVFPGMRDEEVDRVVGALHDALGGPVA